MGTPEADAIGTGGSSRLRAITAEARAIERAAWVWSVLYRTEGQRWRRLNTFLVTLAAALAAVSGGAGFSQVADRRVIATLALAAAAFAAVGSALAGATRASSAEVAASADMALVDAARSFHLTVAPYVTVDEAVKGFEKLCKQRDEVVATMPVTHLPIHRRRFRKLWIEARANQDRRLSEDALALDDRERQTKPEDSDGP